MAKIGDRVEITIKGPTELSGTAVVNTDTGTYKIGDKASMTVTGTIIEDRNGNWVVQFDVPVLGGGRMVIPKSRMP